MNQVAKYMEQNINIVITRWVNFEIAIFSTYVYFGCFCIITCCLSYDAIINKVPPGTPGDYGDLPLWALTFKIKPQNARPMKAAREHRCLPISLEIRPGNGEIICDFLASKRSWDSMTFKSWARRVRIKNHSGMAVCTLYLGTLHSFLY